MKKSHSHSQAHKKISRKISKQFSTIFRTPGVIPREQTSYIIKEKWRKKIWQKIWQQSLKTKYIFRETNSLKFGESFDAHDRTSLFKRFTRPLRPLPDFCSPTKILKSSSSPDWPSWSAWAFLMHRSQSAIAENQWEKMKNERKWKKNFQEKNQSMK